MEIPTITLPAVAPRQAVLDLSSSAWQTWLQDQGQPPLAHRQVRHWLFARRARSFEEMTDLPRDLRRRLAVDFNLFGSRIERQLLASDGTEKLLLRLADEHLIECVLLKESDRRTVCISTQVGCGMGCVFCASGLEGVIRNLSTGEILEQLLQARNLLPADERLTHIVVMGMGEPLANLDNLLAALDLACSPQGLGLSARHVDHLDRRLAGQDPSLCRPGQGLSSGRVAARSQR